MSYIPVKNMFGLCQVLYDQSKLSLCDDTLD